MLGSCGQQNDTMENSIDIDDSETLQSTPLPEDNVEPSLLQDKDALLTNYSFQQEDILQGIEVRRDLDGDGEEERVLVTDHAYGDDAYSAVYVSFKNSNNIATVNYPGYWSSYMVTGDLSGNGRADIVVNMISTGSTYGADNLRSCIWK